MSHKLFEVNFFIAELPLKKLVEPNMFKIALSSLNKEIRGNLVFNLSYTPLTSHPYYKV